MIIIIHSLTHLGLKMLLVASNLKNALHIIKIICISNSIFSLKSQLIFFLHHSKTELQIVIDKIDNDEIFCILKLYLKHKKLSKYQKRQQITANFIQTFPAFPVCCYSSRVIIFHFYSCCNSTTTVPKSSIFGK